MWVLAFFVFVPALTYLMSSFLLSHYSRSDNLGIRNASLVISGGFFLFMLSMSCEGLIPGRTGQWIELCLMSLICFGSLAIVRRILLKSRKCPK
jgi:hypothetical protein